MCVSLVCTFVFILSLFSALQQEVAETESQADLALHLPPCNTDADKPENVYLFDDRILSTVYVGVCICNEKMQELEL